MKTEPKLWEVSGDTSYWIAAVSSEDALNLVADDFRACEYSEAEVAEEMLAYTATETCGGRIEILDDGDGELKTAAAMFLHAVEAGEVPSIIGCSEW